MKKHLFGILAALTLCLCLLTVSASAATVASGNCGAEGDGSNLTWTLSDNGTLTVSGTGDMADYYDIGSVPWYNCRDDIRTVIIESGVTSIGAYAFYECTALQNVYAPVNTLETVGMYAFHGCTVLSNITLPDSVTEIGSCAFSETYLSVVELPDGLTTVASNLFYGSSVREVWLPDSVTEIKSGAFYGCNNLTAVVMPAALKSIGGNAFQGCTSLKSIQIPGSVESIGQFAFWDCSFNQVYGGSVEQWCSIDFAYGNANPVRCATELYLNSILVENLVIPDSVTAIADNAFYNYDRLKSVTIGSGVKSIGKTAFYDCGGLKKVEFKGTAVEIAEDAFQFVQATFLYPAADSSWTTELKLNYGGTLTWSGYYGGTCGAEGDNLTWKFADGTLTISGKGKMADYYNYPVESRPPWAEHRADIKKIVVESGVTGIGKWAFSYCAAPTVQLPSSITDINACAFYGSALTSVTIPSKVTVISSSLFANCTALTTVNLPNGITEIGPQAFDACSKLANISIPAGVTTIGMLAFQCCESLASIQLPEGITRLEMSTFAHCTSLQEITIPKNVTYIDEMALGYCSALKKITFTGSAPLIINNAYAAFDDVVATVYYPADDASWTADKRANYGGTLTWVAVKDKIDFAFARMILGNALDMQFAFPKAGVESGAYVEVVRTAADGSKVAQTIPYADFKSATISGVEHFYVTYSGIAAKEMADTLVATVYDKNGNALSNGWEDSVREYALRSLRAANATAKNKTMLVDMLNYGAAAQTYFSYNASDLANKDLTAAEKALATTAQPCVNEQVKGAKNKGSRLILESSIKVQQAFSGLNNKMYAVVSYTNHNGKKVSERIEGSEFQIASVSIIELDQIALADARTVYTLTIYNANGTKYDTHKDSVASYIARASDNALHTAIMAFADSAYTYFHG